MFDTERNESVEGTLRSPKVEESAFPTIVPALRLFLCLLICGALPIFVS